MQLLQSWLFVPGHRPSMVDKACHLDADAVIFDLEDGVPAAQKEAARQQVAAALAKDSGKPLFVRTHSANHAEFTNDLDAVVCPGLAGIILSKADAVEDVMRVSAALSRVEQQSSIPHGQIRILALIESARGIIQSPAIAGADPRLAGLVFGAEDFALDTNSDPVDDFIYARSALVVAAASAGIQVVDRAHLDLQDTDGLSDSTRQSRRLGFTGRLPIHPRQIAPTHDAFYPAAHEVEHAERVLAAFNPDSGSIVVDGRMVDLPVVERARQTLSLYKRRNS